jgi:hypothetical protein
MVNIRVFIKNISAENFWDVGKSIPQAVQIATNLNVVDIKKKSEAMLEVPFVFTVNYRPAVAQLSFKGISHVIGTTEELEQIIEGHKEKKHPPQIVMQSISNIVFLESVIVCKTLNIPPPIPLPKIAPAGAQKKRSEPTYRA